MKLITAHRILIGAGIAFFAFYAARRAWDWAGTASLASLGHALASGAVVVALIVYFRSLRGWGR